MRLAGAPLIQEVGKRIVARYFEISGATEVEISPAMRADVTGVDIRRKVGSSPVTSKLKVDNYCGTNAAKIADRALSYYRADTSTYALEVLADTTTRASGWLQSSVADELLYYRLAITRPEDEVAALLESPDGVFFGELGVEHDDLRIIPMTGLRGWFAAAGDKYMPRPVAAGGHSSWCRIVPMDELHTGVPGIRVVGPIYSRVGMRG